MGLFDAESIWDKIEETIETQWDKLSEEDLNNIKSNFSDFYKVLASAYKISEVKAKQEVEAFLKKNPLVKTGADALADPKNMKKQAIATARLVQEESADKIKEHPLLSGAVTFISGMALGYLLNTKRA